MANGLWLIASVVAFVASLFATLPIIALLGALLGAGSADVHLVEMALWPVVWGGLACAGIWLAGRLLLRLEAPAPQAIGLAAVGCGLAAWQHVVLQQWEIDRFGIVDPDMVGWTAGLFAVLVGIGVAGFGTFVAPRIVAWVPAFLVVAGTAVALGIGVDNILAGSGDGLAADSIPLAFSMAASAAYAVVASVLSVGRALGRTGISHALEGEGRTDEGAM